MQYYVYILPHQNEVDILDTLYTVEQGKRGYQKNNCKLNFWLFAPYAISV